MHIRHKITILTLILGDIAMLYAALLLTLALRYGDGIVNPLFDQHLMPMSILFAVWLLVFYISGLYDLRRLRNNLDFFQILIGAMGVNAIVGILFFYLVPGFDIAPKTNLFIFLVIFGTIGIIWRRHFNRVSNIRPSTPILLIAPEATGRELARFLEEHPQLGYKIVLHPKIEELPSSREDWQKLLREHSIKLILVSRKLGRSSLVESFFDFFDTGFAIQEVPEFYEAIFRKVPLEEVDAEWFLEHIRTRVSAYEDIKRLLEIIFSFVLAAILSPLLLIIGLLVVLTSEGPAIYSQKRIGKNGKEFTLYKFRSMKKDAETQGPQWALQNDSRSTAIGKILRASHLDEFPQLLNIFKGDLSFTGPRPERPEIAAKLKLEVPYYDVRTLIKPGVTGWAQIHHRADLSVEDVKEKLAYDIFYLKNRSFVLDLAIVLKTIKAFFSTPR